MKSVVATMMVLAVGLGACKVDLSVETKTRYTRADGDVTVAASSAYVAGDKVAVAMLGVKTSGIGLSYNGGVIVNTADTDHVSVTARVVGYAYKEHKDEATTVIGESASSVKITKVGDTWQISCDQNASANADAGCELLTVTVPRGTTAAPLDVDVNSQLGTINANFGNDVVANLTVEANGASPEIVAQALPAVGANIVLASDDGPVRLDLPSDVSVDTVQLTGRTEAQATAGETYSDCSFPNATFDGTSFSIGTLGAGASRVRLTGETVRLKKPGES